MTKMEFRFLAVCRAVADNSLIDVLNQLEFRREEFPATVDLTIAVSLIVMPHMHGKRLDLMAFQVGKDGSPKKVPGYVGTPLILPKDGVGAGLFSHLIKMPIPERGFFGFYLFDPEGLFGEKNELLATYIYAVDVKDEGHRNN